MTKYVLCKDVAEVGFEGDVVELDEARAAAMEEGSVKVYDNGESAGSAQADVVPPANDVPPAQEAPAGIVPKGFFSLEVAWREGTTESEREVAMPFIKDFTEAMGESREDHFPLCIDSLKIKRDR